MVRPFLVTGKMAKNTGTGYICSAQAMEAGTCYVAWITGDCHSILCQIDSKVIF